MTFRCGLLSAFLLISGCATQGNPPPTQPATLLLISVDGLRPADVTADQMPALDALGNANVRAEGMRPSYPSLTFPNHYTLVTGLRPDQHGIIHNSMEDAGLGEFRLSNREAVGNGGWWQGGTPVWISVQRAGLRSATMFWPGSEAEIDGMRPWQWRVYDGAISDADRVAQVLEWLRLPTAERPHFVTLYFDKVDSVSHEYGPDSPQAIATRRLVDAAIAQLLQGLGETGQLASTNLVIVSDHGLAAVPPEQVLRIEALAPDDIAEAVTFGQVLGFNPRPGRIAEAERLLLGRHDHYQCWRKAELPARWHYGRHPRIPAIVCQMDEGWDAHAGRKLEALARQPRHTRGSHGYDPALASMQASFIAAGPAFGRGVRLPAFDNVDVYPLLMRLLQLPPERNDGDIAPLLPALEPAR